MRTQKNLHLENGEDLLKLIYFSVFIVKIYIEYLYNFWKSDVRSTKWK